MGLMNFEGPDVVCPLVQFELSEECLDPGLVCVASSQHSAAVLNVLR